MASLIADEAHPSLVQELGVAGNRASAPFLCGRYAPSDGVTLQGYEKSHAVMELARGLLTY